jgi:hypothetical protein
MSALLLEKRRRLAVVDHTGRLLGLLCLKHDGRGYCTDEGIRARATEARRSALNQHVSPAGLGVRR